MAAKIGNLQVPFRALLRLTPKRSIVVAGAEDDLLGLMHNLQSLIQMFFPHLYAVWIPIFVYNYVFVQMEINICMCMYLCVTKSTDVNHKYMLCHNMKFYHW